MSDSVIVLPVFSLPIQKASLHVTVPRWGSELSHCRVALAYSTFG